MTDELIKKQVLHMALMTGVESIYKGEESQDVELQRVGCEMLDFVLLGHLWAEIERGHSLGKTTDEVLQIMRQHYLERMDYMCNEMRPEIISKLRLN
jgi:hypothetical protein